MQSGIANKDECFIKHVGFRVVVQMLVVEHKIEYTRVAAMANFQSKQNPSSNDDYGGGYMEEEKGFSSNQLGLTENTPKWAFLHI